IGNLSSQNEILALRSSGFHVKNIFLPILVISLFLSASTLLIADRMIPYTTERYKEKYAQILQSVPTLELKSYSSTRFGRRVISNGVVEGNVINDVLVFDDSNSRDSRVISATSGKITLLDINRFLYRLDLENPQILITNSSALDDYSLAKASSMSLYLDLSSNASGLVSITPSQMSISQLKQAVSEKYEDQITIENQWQHGVSSDASKLAVALSELERGSSFDVSSALNNAENYSSSIKSSDFSFYYQYYRSELQKKVALSLACTFLVFMAFPISFFRVKSGRLIGFGISMFIAVAYWFFLYYMHVKAISTPLHPALFIWIPNLVVFVTGFCLLLRVRK
ncbi:MAG: LptF/LptG family permease, partial [Spirochaetales bacterium]|nr:LptF/LptG family permease [Spirochaetales bacterium]